MTKRAAFVVISLRCAAGWLAGFRLEARYSTYFCMLSSAKNLLHLSVFRKFGLLGRCWALIAQVAGSLFLCREGFLASRTGSVLMHRDPMVLVEYVRRVGVPAAQ
jgi:hypothetical protein